MAKKRRKRWIQKAVKRPGRMTAECKRRGFSGPTCECLRVVSKTAKSKSLRSAANLGLRFKGCGGKKL